MARRSLIIVSLLVIASVVLAACGGGGGGSAKVIKIATQSPLSGDMSVVGVDIKRGAELAVEQLGGPLTEMGFKIEKTSVTALSRALRATYTMELAQDLRAVHGLDAETELANILSTEILAEINMEIVDGIKTAAKNGGYQEGGTFNLTTHSDGRWSVEKYKGLIYQIERDANAIALDTRRGKGNFIVVSSNVASATF